MTRRTACLGLLFSTALGMVSPAGFALVESGMRRAKGVSHAMGMSGMICAIGMTGFWIAGFALMVGGLVPVLSMDGPNIRDKMVSFNIGGKPFEVLGYK